VAVVEVDKRLRVRKDVRECAGREFLADPDVLVLIERGRRPEDGCDAVECERSVAGAAVEAAYLGRRRARVQAEARFAEFAAPPVDDG